MKAGTIFNILFLPLLALLYFLNIKKEAFGTSPGTLVQLAANHVPSAVELNAAQSFYSSRPDPTILIVMIMMLILLLGVVMISK